MTGEYMESGMVQLAQEMKNALQSECAQLRADEKTAAKAYQISISILDQAIKLVTMKFSDKAYDERYYSVREQRVFNNPKAMYFADCREWFERANDAAAKEAFLVYAHAVQMLRSVFLEAKEAELAFARQTGAVEKSFECNIIINTLQTLLKRWEELWKAGEGVEHE